MDAVCVDANDVSGGQLTASVQDSSNREEDGILVRQLRQNPKKTTLRLLLRESVEGDVLRVDVASPLAFRTLSPSLDTHVRETPRDEATVPLRRDSTLAR